MASYSWLVVSTYPSEKYDFVSWDDEMHNIWKDDPNVPNHHFFVPLWAARWFGHRNQRLGCGHLPIAATQPMWVSTPQNKSVFIRSRARVRDPPTRNTLKARSGTTKGPGCGLDAHTCFTVAAPHTTKL